MLKIKILIIFIFSILILFVVDNFTKFHTSLSVQEFYFNPTVESNNQTAKSVTSEKDVDSAKVDIPVDNRKRIITARLGENFVEKIDDQLVIHLAGTHYEMGFAHGKMLAKRIEQVLESYNSWGFRNSDFTPEDADAIWKESEAFIPQEFKDELKGLSDGSGIELLKFQRMHILPSKFHCSGAAVWNKATIDGKLYHYRSLDYSLEIGDSVRLQENACLIVRKPKAGIASVVVGWCGSVGSVTGMNAEGISIGEMGVGSKDETFTGKPMFFFIREILEKANNLTEAIEMKKKGPRTCGYNFIFADGKTPEAAAIEVDRNRVAVFYGGDEKENIEPHYSIENCVRRINHHVDTELSKFSRTKGYDPRKHSVNSWLSYKKVSDFILESYGKFNADKMIELCKLYPPMYSCLHHAIFCPTDGRFWVANAKDPAKFELAGAQNFKYYPYNLKNLLHTNPDNLTIGEDVIPVPAKSSEPAEPGVITGFAYDSNLPNPEMTEEVKKHYAKFKKYENDEKYKYKMTLKVTKKEYDMYDVEFPSALEHGPKQNNLVAGVYYAQKLSDKPAPAVVILHHLQNDQTLERLLAGFFTTKGISSIVLYLPFYGSRSSNKKFQKKFLSADLEFVEKTFIQSVFDIRRANQFLKARPEVDKEKVALLGISLGGCIAGLSGGVDPLFDKYILVLAGGDFAEIIFNNSNETREIKAEFEKLNLTKEKAREMFASVEPLTYAGFLPKDKILMFNTLQDEIIPKTCTDQLWEKFNEPEIYWYPGKHASIAFAANKILPKILKFIQK